MEPYGSRKNNYARIEVERFLAGGSFPEFFVAQLPFERLTSTAESHEVERVSYKRRQEIPQISNFSFTKRVLLNTNERPGREIIEASQQKTKKGIDLRLGSRSKVASSVSNLKSNGPSYIKYLTHAEEKKQDSIVISMHKVPSDPLEPSKFRHKKVPRSSNTTVPETIQHSPERENNIFSEDWTIPASVSNWKNPKGYTIPLDKRLAADGRNLNSLQINDRFADLSEALYLAEHKARQAVEIRANIQKELHVKQKEKMEYELRNLAQIVRKEKEN